MQFPEMGIAHGFLRLQKQIRRLELRERHHPVLGKELAQVVQLNVQRQNAVLHFLRIHFFTVHLPVGGVIFPYDARNKQRSPRIISAKRDGHLCAIFPAFDELGHFVSTAKKRWLARQPDAYRAYKGALPGAVWPKDEVETPSRNEFHIAVCHEVFHLHAKYGTPARLLLLLRIRCIIRDVYIPSIETRFLGGSARRVVSLPHTRHFRNKSYSRVSGREKVRTNSLVNTYGGVSRRRARQTAVRKGGRNSFICEMHGNTRCFRAFLYVFTKQGRTSSTTGTSKGKQ
mmetsp:Transcript_2834/g.4773  ORF Transcript_2834/g.4773 Transcript_2834/m.4773 type:complete len:286 (-) Transcript_2834:54-911(-)